MQNALIVAQAFKGTLGVTEVAAALRDGVRDARWRPDVILGSDGGDGLLDALSASMTRWTAYEAVGPIIYGVRPRVGWLSHEVAVIESRLVIGLSLVPPEKRQPMRATTRGLGTLIERAIADGATRIIVGLGGSATVDGGLGMARAFGWVPFAAGGRILPEGGGALSELERLEPGRTLGVEILGLCDVDNPLLGPEGAAPVFAPQKGATPEDVERLVRGFERLAAATGERGTEAARRRGAGAAGGTGFGLVVFAAGELVSGAEWMLDRTDFAGRLASADTVVVCEGAFDRTSRSGKLSGIAIDRARAAGLPVLLVTPSASDVPDGVIVESGASGTWSAARLRARVARGLSKVGRLLAQ